MNIISICNAALSFIGQPAIADINENTPVAKYCKLHYEPARDYVLREHAWNFAEARVRLARLQLPESWAREYSFAYAYPRKCARVHWLITAQGQKDERFKVGMFEDERLGEARSEARRAIYTNLPEAVAAYTMLVTDAGLYDAAFALAVARRLQCLLIKPLLKNNHDAVREAEQLYQAALYDAKTADAQEGRKFQDSSKLWNGGHYDGDWVDMLTRGGGY